MKKVAELVLSRLVAGALVVVPIYLASLLLLKVVSRWEQGSKNLVAAMET